MLCTCEVAAGGKRQANADVNTRVTNQAVDTSELTPEYTHRNVNMNNDHQLFRSTNNYRSTRKIYTEDVAKMSGRSFYRDDYGTEVWKINFNKCTMITKENATLKQTL